MSNSRLEILIVALAGLLAPVVQAQQIWALDAVKIYPAPDMAPISGKILIAGTKIQSVVPASETRAMAATRAPQCKGGVVVAGFQNSHVHFTSDEFLTLQLFQFELEKQHVPAGIADRLLNESVAEFGKFAAMGGQVLFGTDVGYMTDYDPAREYELMAKAGLTPMQILASLTTTPAARWKEQNRRGRIAAGMDADIVVLDADPADSPRNFAAVRCAIRGGEVIYARQ